MPKDDDFGGIPEVVFVPMVRDIQAGAPLGLTGAQQVQLLAALAIAEHTSAKSTKPLPNVGDYTLISLDIDNLVKKIRTQGGPQGADIVNLLREITNYQNLW